MSIANHEGYQGEDETKSYGAIVTFTLETLNLHNKILTISIYLCLYIKCEFNSIQLIYNILFLNPSCNCNCNN